jgi:hypothetical protein
MPRLADSISALERLQNEIKLSIDEMLQSGITSVYHLDAEVPKSNDARTYVRATIPPNQFSFYKTNCVFPVDLPNCDTNYVLEAELKHSTLSTEVCNNERDWLALTPLDMRKEFIEDIEEELRTSSECLSSDQKLAILNSYRSLEKLKQSLDGETPHLKTYNLEFQPEILPLIYLKEAYKNQLDLVKREVKKLGIKKCLHVSTAFTKEGHPISIMTTPSFFPLEYTTSFMVESHFKNITYCEFKERGLRASFDGGINVFTTVPFRRRNLLFKLEPMAKKKLLESFKRQMEWFRSMSLGKQQELYQRNPRVKQTLEFYGQLQKDVFGV